MKWSVRFDAPFYRKQTRFDVWYGYVCIGEDIFNAENVEFESREVATDMR